MSAIDAMRLALDALESVELVKEETSVYVVEDVCAWCEAVGRFGESVTHREDCTRQVAIEALKRTIKEENGEA